MAPSPYRTLDRGTTHIPRRNGALPNPWFAETEMKNLEDVFYWVRVKVKISVDEPIFGKFSCTVGQQTRFCRILEKRWQKGVNIGFQHTAQPSSVLSIDSTEFSCEWHNCTLPLNIKMTLFFLLLLENAKLCILKVWRSRMRSRSECRCVFICVYSEWVLYLDKI